MSTPQLCPELVGELAVANGRYVEAKFRQMVPGGKRADNNECFVLNHQ
jgi:hypothetical protein